MAHKEAIQGVLDKLYTHTTNTKPKRRLCEMVCLSRPPRIMADQLLVYGPSRSCGMGRLLQYHHGAPLSQRNSGETVQKPLPSYARSIRRHVSSLQERDVLQRRK